MKPDPRKIEGLTRAAANQANAIGLSEAEVLEMVRKSAPFRSPGLNRRFEDMAFMIGNQGVHRVVHLGRARRGADLLRDLDEILAQLLDDGTFSPHSAREAREAIKAELG